MLYVLAATLGVNALSAQLGWAGRVSHGHVLTWPKTYAQDPCRLIQTISTMGGSMALCRGISGNDL
jgi:hypothetical protein